MKRGNRYRAMCVCLILLGGGEGFSVYMDAKIVFPTASAMDRSRYISAFIMLTVDAASLTPQHVFRGRLNWYPPLKQLLVSS